MKNRSCKNNLENRFRSILLDDEHFLFRLKKKSTSSTWSCFDIINEKGITLIALIITIILMLILAGVVINLTIGENGIFNMAKFAAIKTEEEKAREKLELALADLQARKYTDDTYDENDYIDKYLTKEGMIVIQDTVTVDGWKFTIDRSVPQIGESLGQGEESKKITLTPNVENAIDYTKATIKIEITYEGTITQVKLNGTEEEIPQKDENGKYIIAKEVETNGKYTIYVKDENDEYRTTIANVTEISEDMEIRNAEDLVYFRDRVNKGATYEGRTITVVKDLDLSGACYEVDGTIQNDISWKPIGDYHEDEEGRTSHIFKGIFNGNYHKIENLYINTDVECQGLFSDLENATIKNITIDNSTIKASNTIGSIAGTAYDITLENIHTTSNVTVNATTPNEYGCYLGGLVGDAAKSSIINSSNGATVMGKDNYAGGIAGVFSGTISECYNLGFIDGEKTVGGIIGVNYGDATITNCYNKGIIDGDQMIGGISGNAHEEGILTITNCYNIGTITGNKRVAEIVGTTKSTTQLTNCYTKTDNIVVSNLGDAYADDEENINNGYPILTWQIKKTEQK